MASIDLDQITYNVMAYVMFSLRDHAANLRADFERRIRQRREFVDCLKVDGGYDYIALATCSTVTDFNQLCETLVVSKCAHVLPELANASGAKILSKLCCPCSASR